MSAKKIVSTIAVLLAVCLLLSGCGDYRVFYRNNSSVYFERDINTHDNDNDYDSDHDGWSLVGGSKKVGGKKSILLTAYGSLFVVDDNSSLTLQEKISMLEDDKSLTASEITLSSEDILELIKNPSIVTDEVLNNVRNSKSLKNGIYTSAEKSKRGYLEIGECETPYALFKTYNSEMGWHYIVVRPSDLSEVEKNQNRTTATVATFNISAAPRSQITLGGFQARKSSQTLYLKIKDNSGHWVDYTQPVQSTDKLVGLFVADQIPYVVVSSSNNYRLLAPDPYFTSLSEIASWNE